MRKNWKKLLLFSFIFACLTMAVGPFAVPVPELTDLVDASTFIEPDSKFIKINGVDIPTKKPDQASGCSFSCIHLVVVHIPGAR